MLDADTTQQLQGVIVDSSGDLTFLFGHGCICDFQGFCFVCLRADGFCCTRCFICVPGKHAEHSDHALCRFTRVF